MCVECGTYSSLNAKFHLKEAVLDVLTIEVYAHTDDSVATVPVVVDAFGVVVRLVAVAVVVPLAVTVC